MGRHQHGGRGDLGDPPQPIGSVVALVHVFVAEHWADDRSVKVLCASTSLSDSRALTVNARAQAVVRTQQGSQFHTVLDAKVTIETCVNPRRWAHATSARLRVRLPIVLGRMQRCQLHGVHGQDPACAQEKYALLWNNGAKPRVQWLQIHLQKERELLAPAPPCSLEQSHSVLFHGMQFNHR